MALILIKAVQKVYPDMDEWDTERCIIPAQALATCRT
jgi:hypothetical protein